MMKTGVTYKTIGDVADIICGQDYKSVQDDYGKYPVYGTGGIMCYASQYRCPANSIIIGRKGSINNPLFVEESFWNVDTAFGVVPKCTEVIPKYFFYFCCSYDFTKHDVSVTIPSLRRTDIIKIQLPVPPINDQERIVAELDLLTGIIDKQRAQLRELDTLARSIFYDMFGDSVENEKGWDVNVLGAVCKLKAGKSIKASELSDIPSEGLYPCYGGNGIRGYIAKKSHSGAFPIIGRQGALCGNVNLAKGEFYATEHAVVCTPTHILDSMFMFFTLANMNLNQYAKGVAQPGLAVSNITPLPIIVPPFSIQQSFARKIASIESQKSTITRSIAETQKLFDYTMDKYFG